LGGFKDVDKMGPSTCPLGEKRRYNESPSNGLGLGQGCGFVYRSGFLIGPAHSDADLEAAREGDKDRSRRGTELEYGISEKKKHEEDIGIGKRVSAPPARKEPCEKAR